MRTIIGMVLDESSSMGEGGKALAAISAFNEYVQTQQSGDEDECLLAVVRFNSEAVVTQPMLPVADAQMLTRSNYKPSGMTALNDGIRFAIETIESGLRDDDRVLCVILTDGGENSSKRTTPAEARALIAAREATERWTFVYLSADPAAFADGMNLGIAAGNIAKYADDAAGVSDTFRVMAENTRSYRASNLTKSSVMSAGVGDKGWPDAFSSHTIKTKSPVPHAQPTKGPENNLDWIGK